MKTRDGLRDALEEALAQEGCALCRISERSVRRALQHVLYDMVNDPGVRSQVRASLGYCNRHAWQMLDLRGNALGLALLYRDAVLELEEQLNTLKPSHSRTRIEKLRDQGTHATGPRRECPACKQQREIEDHHTSSLLHALADPAFVEKLEASDGLCRLHLGRALGTAPNATAFETLLHAQRGVHRRLIGELGEFIRKNDFRFKSEGFGQEADSWIRAIGLISSGRGAQNER